jgi:polysaccharide export outer membrane protein
VYFNNLDQTQLDTISNYTPLQIQSGDILQVTVSTIDRDVVAIFNPVSSTAGSAAGYVVDAAGYIDMPMIGKVYVKGKTLETINKDLKAALETSIKNVFVSTRLLNFRISILGDVGRPGTYGISNDRVTLLEALSLAGDVHLSAQLDDVLLIREIEGKKKYITLDLNDSKTLSSPYYYLANNDVIYVKPGTTKVIANTTTIQLIPIIAGALSLLLIITNAIRVR